MRFIWNYLIQLTRTFVEAPHVPSMATGDRLPLSSRAFLSAVRSGQVEVVKKILASESRRNDINVQNDWGDTALLIAAHLGYLTICKMLLAGGACSAKQNNRGETCLHRACVTGNVKIVEAILGDFASPGYQLFFQHLF